MYFASILKQRRKYHLEFAKVGRSGCWEMVTWPRSAAERRFPCTRKCPSFPRRTCRRWLPRFGAYTKAEVHCVDTAYLDNNATTIVSPGVMEAMLPFFRERFHNVTSVAGEAEGLRSVLGQARKKVSDLLGLDEPEECIFTSGATEANNWAIYGIAESCRAAGHAITTGLEHPSVLEAFHRLESHGWTVTVLPPDKRGLITAESVKGALRALHFPRSGAPR